MAIEHHVSLPTAGWDIQGKKLAIVGYSHHTDGTEGVNFTRDLTGDIASGKKHAAFFTNISGYFGLSNAEFWPHVMFFNFLPSRIGGKDEKYKTALDHGSARDRVSSILSEHDIERIMVFSTKAWNNFPHTDGELLGERCQSLFQNPSGHLYRVEVGTYTIRGRRILAAGFRHPERANAEQMRNAVKTFMKLR